MVFLDVSFQLLTYFGLWKPVSCNTVEDIVDDIYMISNMFLVCAKIFGLLRWRKEILEICRSFEAFELELRTPDELAIQERYKTIRFYFLAYIIMCNMASSANTLGRLYGNRGLNILPYRIYLPYNYSSKQFLYQFTVLLQSITFFIAINIDVVFDTLFFGVMVQMISKINILKHRFQVTVTALAEIHDKKSLHMEDYKKIEDKLFTNWIKSHNAIIRIYDYTEFAFSKVIFVQYSFSTLPICISVYSISQMDTFTTEFMSNLVVLIALTCEIFIFCFAANEVTSEVRITFYIHLL
ncbi:hypothetical protein PV326_011743 [Microctonus aethiopoides]|nr:hypothetical protein PV326_011743 [Microctonus aethiopoides]